MPRGRPVDVARRLRQKRALRRLITERRTEREQSQEQSMNPGDFRHLLDEPTYDRLA